jgi:hypothetical protein
MRVQKVLALYSDVDTPQYLSRTVLSLQLLSHIQNMCGQLCGQAEPLLVRLAKRLPSKTLSSDFARNIGAFHLDPDLGSAASDCNGGGNTFQRVFAVAISCVHFIQQVQS